MSLAFGGWGLCCRCSWWWEFLSHAALVQLIKQRFPLVLHGWSFFKQRQLSISKIGNKIFEVWQFMEKWECFIQTMGTGSSLLKYWAGIFLQIRLQIRRKINWFSLVSVAVKPLSSERLSYTLGDMEIKEGLENNSAESLLLPRPRQTGMGPGGVRRKGKSSGRYMAEWKRF